LKFKGVGENFAAGQICDAAIPFSALLLKCLAFVLQRNVTMAPYHFTDGDGHVGNDAMTIPDYVAIGFLLMTLLAAARWFAQRKFEL
jgi:hypothetical protein